MTPLERRLVAVMFTDMVGYTALLQSDERRALVAREHYWSALERHHAASGGTIVQRLGDGSMSMFPSALAAAEAGVGIQQELSAAGVDARIGVHIGETIVEAERLTGDAVNIAARIESFAPAGSVLLSDSAHEQIANRGELDTVCLGEFRLKNVGRPFELYAVAGDGLVVPEPGELEGKGDRIASLATALPGPRSTLLGRADDLARLAELVRGHRVVTLTGPGGVGKTSVLVELGRMLSPEHPGGVALVELADVTDPAQFIPALAEALDVKEADGRSLAEGVIVLIGETEVLLLLDNLEQIISAAPEVASLSERCPGLRIVTTSRAPLHIAPEREYVLEPLPEDDAVALFCDRAAVAEPVEAVREICRRLDGLPLAVELAAARTRLLPPDQLLDRLDSALEVLSSRAPDLPERQRALRSTIDWSHSLLTDSEQRLFRRMAVFTGGCAVEDVEAVCGEPGEALLDVLESLVDNALVQSRGTGRLRMLETIREFALERLAAAGEAEVVARKHAERYAQVAREIREGVEGAAQVAAVQRGIAEEGNLQAAIDALLLAARGGDKAACETGMQLSGDLWMYWHIRGKNVSAQEHAEAFLRADRDGAPSVGRAGALLSVGLASWMSGQLERADAEWNEANEIAGRIDAGRELCLAALCLALGQLSVGKDATEWADLGAERSSALDLDWAFGFNRSAGGMAYAARGDRETAQARFAEALQIQERLGDLEGSGMSLGGLAQLAAGRGETAEAIDLYRRSLTAFETIGDRGEEARILSEMGWTQIANGDLDLARRSFLQAIRAHTDIASVRGVGLALLGLAAADAAAERNERAVQLAAAAEVYAQQEGIVVVYSGENPGTELVERARASLSPDELERAMEAGRRLTIDEAIALARGSA